MPATPAAAAVLVRCTEWAVSAVLVPATTGTRDRFDDGAPQVGLLGIGEDRAFTRGAGHDHKVVAVLGQPAGQGHRAVDVEVASRVEGRDHGAAHRPEASSRSHDESLSVARGDGEHVARGGQIPSSTSNPTVTPGRVGTWRIAASTPGINDWRSYESCRIVRLWPAVPSRTS